MAFAVYRSSAGSGKTFTLVLEYLKIILAEPGDFRHILAITFTNKAAAEMKERIIETLEALSAKDNGPDPGLRSAMLPLLTAETGLTPPAIAEKSGQALNLILHNYSEFAIGTIDSFSQRIIRTFAFDFGLSNQFNVVVDHEELIATAVDMLLESAGNNEEITQLLVDFLESRMEEEQGWNIDRIFKSFAERLFVEDIKDRLNLLQGLSIADFMLIAKELQNFSRDFEDRIVRTAARALQIIEESGIPESSFFKGKYGICSYFRKLQDRKPEEPSTTLLQAIKEDKWTASKVSDLDRKAIMAMREELRDLFNSVQALLGEQGARYRLSRLMLKTIYPLAVLREIDRVMNAFKKQNNIVHISEFNSRISSVITGEPVPFVYERLGERYRHIMIDEFQDTSRLQWENFVPLVENALSSGYYNLVVGDGKQAIYRWRSGDANQFSILPKLAGSETDPVVRARQQVLETHYVKKNLDTNYRSRAEIVGFNNRFFGFLSDVSNDFLKLTYSDAAQKALASKPGGYVKICFRSNNHEEREANGTTMYGDEILGIIRSLTGKGFRLGDIAILCRQNRQASDISRMLSLQEIAVISPESLILLQSPAVRFIVDFIRFLREPTDAILQCSVAGFLVQTGKISGMTWEELFGLISDKRFTAGEGLKRALETHGFSFSRMAMLSLPLYDLCEQIIRLFNLRGEADSFIQFFLDAILEFETGEFRGIPDFIDWWEQKGQHKSVLAPKGMNAVNIMTIHQAKGLQFPVVILPFGKEHAGTGKDYLWADLSDYGIPLPSALLRSETALLQTPLGRDYQEEREKTLLDQVNVWYVAMTRPEERLYMIVPEPPKNAGNALGLSAFLVRFLKAEGLYYESDDSYELGIASQPEPKTSGSFAQPETPGNFTSEDWRNRILIRRRAPSNWDAADPGTHVRYGTMVHALLSAIKTAGDVLPAIEAGVSNGLVPAGDREKIGEMLTSLVNDPVLKNYFLDPAEVRIEPDILLPGGKTCRPDRIVISGEILHILEFKTGKKDTEHIDQVEQYAGVMAEMGYRGINRHLVYLGESIEVVSW